MKHKHLTLFLLLLFLIAAVRCQNDCTTNLPIPLYALILIIGLGLLSLVLLILVVVLSIVMCVKDSRWKKVSAGNGGGNGGGEIKNVRAMPKSGPNNEQQMQTMPQKPGDEYVRTLDDYVNNNNNNNMNSRNNNMYNNNNNNSYPINYSNPPPTNHMPPSQLYQQQQQQQQLGNKSGGYFDNTHMPFNPGMNQQQHFQQQQSSTSNVRGSSFGDNAKRDNSLSFLGGMKGGDEPPSHGLITNLYSNNLTQYGQQQQPKMMGNGPSQSGMRDPMFDYNRGKKWYA